MHHHAFTSAGGAGFLTELRPRLGELLVRRGLIAQESLDRALSEQRSTERLGETLVRLRLARERDIARTLAGQLQLPFVELRTAGVDRAAARLLTPATARYLLAIPIRRNADGTVVVAAADPTEIDPIELVRAVGAPVHVEVAELSAVKAVLDRAFSDR